MSKTWILVVAIALITMLGIAGYEFFQSVNGANSEFTKTIGNGAITSDLGVKQLKFVLTLKESILVNDKDIQNLGKTTSVTTTPIVTPPTQ